jgi:hypothetical protein
MKLNKGVLARYKTKVEIKTFTSMKGAQFFSIYNAVLGTVPKRLLFKSCETPTTWAAWIPLKFRYDMNYFSLFVEGKQYPNKGFRWT